VSPHGLLQAVADGLADCSQQHPDAHIVRNIVGNIVFLHPDGTDWGYVDVMTGEWAYFDFDEAEP
jgi:hypothetical protein